MENITLNGREYTVEIEDDQNSDAPWENSDGHGIVSDWESRDKRAGELILNTDRRSKRFYDYAETLKIARRDKWGVYGKILASEEIKKGRALTSREITALSVMRDYEYLHAWCNNDWNYVGVIVTGPDGETASLWGIESNCDNYQQEVAAELAEDLDTEYSVKNRFNHAMNCGV